MKVSRKWIIWAHEPVAESGGEESLRLCELAEAPGKASIEITDPNLLKELVSVAECYRNPRAGDSLFEMGPWWCGQPKKIIEGGRAALRAAQMTPEGRSCAAPATQSSRV